MRFAPVELPDSRQVRLQRLYPKTLLKTAVRTMLVPVPKSGAAGGGSGRASGATFGGEPLRDTELLAWCAEVVQLGTVRGMRKLRREAPVPSKKLLAAAVAAGACTLLAACSPVKVGAAAVVGNQRITQASLATQVSSLQSDIAQYFPGAKVNDAVLPRLVLGSLITFAVRDQTARDLGVTVSQADMQQATDLFYASAQQQQQQGGSSFSSQQQFIAAQGIPLDLKDDLGRYYATEVDFIKSKNGGKLPTTNSTAVQQAVSQFSRAECRAAKELQHPGQPAVRAAGLQPEHWLLRGQRRKRRAVGDGRLQARDRGAVRPVLLTAAGPGASLLTILVTSSRVAPGLLSWQAWAALREASRVLAGSAGHPQVPALTVAGVVPEIVDAPPDVAGLARMLSAAVAAGGPVVWLAPAGAAAAPQLLAALAEAADEGPAHAGGAVRVLHGSHDLPGAHLLDVVATMATLRASCPWDRRQTHASLAPHLIEESYEALDALEQGDAGALREELGDVLLQVAFHAVIAGERGPGEGGYTIDDIADTLVAKLVRRHPHVFGDLSAGSADEVTRNWDEIKKAERAAKHAAAGADAAAAPPSVLDGIVLGQPALSLAAQVLRRAARAGYPGEPAGAGAVGDADHDGLGGQLMRLVMAAREAGLDPEAALRVTVRTYIAQINDWERSVTLRAGAVIENSMFRCRLIYILYFVVHYQGFGRLCRGPGRAPRWPRGPGKGAELL